MTAERIHFNKAANNTNQALIRSAALTAGFSILTMVIAAPFAELYVFAKLIVKGNAEATTRNIIANESLFWAGTFGYLVTFICDLLAAWALYILLKPVNHNLALLTDLLRWVYTFIALVAFANLVAVLNLLNNTGSLSAFEPTRLYEQIQFSINAFKTEWYFGILFFGIHLLLLGYLVFRLGYISRIAGMLLIIAGLGYLVNGLKPILFPHINLDAAKFTFYGELIFMLWLLTRGSKIQFSN